jgi:hypothetical protein
MFTETLADGVQCRHPESYLPNLSSVQPPDLQGIAFPPTKTIIKGTQKIK